MKKTAIVIGASSGLGLALSEQIAQSGCDVILAARNISKLLTIRNYLQEKYNVCANVLPIDLSKIDKNTANAYLESCFKEAECITHVYITAAIMSEKDNGETSSEVLIELFQTNFFGISVFVNELAKKTKGRSVGITVISSIAAIRARGQNIAYSSSKVALEFFLLGLKHYHAESNMNIQIYRIGYMDTPLSQSKKMLILPTSSMKVAKYIFEHRDSRFGIRYFPKFWKYVSIILTFLPWIWYKKFKF